MVAVTVDEGCPMLTDLEEKRTEVEAACRRAGVRRLTVFGSALTDAFDPERSDVDFLVEFDESADDDLFDAYFSLQEELATVLERPVDLLMADAVKNPYLTLRVPELIVSLTALQGEAGP